MAELKLNYKFSFIKEILIKFGFIKPKEYDKRIISSFNSVSDKELKDFIKCDKNFEKIKKAILTPYDNVKKQFNDSNDFVKEFQDAYLFNINKNNKSCYINFSYYIKFFNKSKQRLLIKTLKKLYK